MKYHLVKRKNPQNKTQSKYYASPINAGRKTLRDISKDIAGRSSLTRGDIESVLLNFVDRLPSYLKDGHSVQLGEFGTMRLSLSSKGADSEKAFNADTIKTRVVFTPGVEMKHEMRETSYEIVHEPKAPKLKP